MERDRDAAVRHDLVFGALDLTEACAVWRALGIGHVDLGLLHGPALDRSAVLSDPVGVASRVASIGMPVANLYWLFGQGLDDRALTDPAARDRNRADFASVLVFAEAIGAGSIFVLPGVIGPGASRQEGMEAASSALRELVADAQARGIALTVEPHVGGILDSPARTAAFLEMVPGLRLTLDYAHFVCLGHTQAEIDPLAPHAAHVHLRQARPGALQAKWSEGTIDFAAVIDRLRAVDYEGFLSIEYVHQAYMNTLFEDVLTETVRMRDFLRSSGVV